MREETIAAIATAPGKGGVAILRLSGDDALKIAEKAFRPSGKTPVSAFEPYRMYPGEMDCGTFSDYGLCVYFQAPKSYTGEDVVEFHLHGGTSISRGALKRLFALGARGAGRGEFTKRAFLNGKLSLSSAEGVADMINGESEAEVRAGYLLYGETLTKRVRTVQDELKNTLAAIGAAVDYPEEDLEEETRVDVRGAVERAKTEISALAAGYAVGKKIKSGVSVAICGKPNTGKSSLLNRLLGYEKAIVSDIAGTTRDVVEGTVEINGVRFHLSDTAGVRESEDKIEAIGVDRAERLVKASDLAVFVADLTSPLDENDVRALEAAKGRPLVKVYNKADLVNDEKETDADVTVSAVTGEGLNKLKALLYEKGVGLTRTEDTAFLVEERHYLALNRAIEGLSGALGAIENCPLDLVELEIRRAWTALGEITGETASEEIIGEIFAKFCVGK